MASPSAPPARPDLFPVCTVLLQATDSPAPAQSRLAGYGARPWQVELTAIPLTKALLRILEKGSE